MLWGLGGEPYREFHMPSNKFSEFLKGGVCSVAYLKRHYFRIGRS